MFTPVRPRGFAALAALLGLLSCGQVRAEWIPNGNPAGAGAWGSMDPSVAPDGSGGAFVAWGLGICAGIQHFEGRGEYAAGWPAAGLPTRDCNGYAPVGDRHTRVVPDGEGGVYVASTVWPACVGCQVDPMYVLVQRLDGDGRFVPGWPAVGISALSQTWQRRLDRNETPRVAPNGRFGVLLAWQCDYSWSGGIGTGPLVVQSLAPDGTRRWGDQGVLVCSATGYRSVPEIVPDGLGGAFVFWCEQRPPDSLGCVYAQHVTSTGAIAWTPDGLVVSERYRLRFVEKPLRLLLVAPPFAIGDGGHGAIVAWSGARGADLDVFAARVTYGGGLPWRHDTQVCAAPGDQFDARLVLAGRGHGPGGRSFDSFGPASGPGDAIVGWLDSRADGVRVSAQRLTSSGRIAWAPGGVEVGPAVIAAPYWAPRSLLAMAGDGSGGAYFAWPDDRAEGSLFAVRLGPDGRPAGGWLRGGTSVVGLAEVLGTADMAEVGGGNAILAWQNTAGAARVTMLRAHGPAATPGVSSPVESSPVDPAPDPSGWEAFAARPAVSTPPAVLRLAPGASPGRLRFTLLDDSPAMLELFDVMGRKAWTREVGGLGGGEHELAVSEARLAPGVYLARLAQAGLGATARILVAW